MSSFSFDNSCRCADSSRDLFFVAESLHLLLTTILKLEPTNLDSSIVLLWPFCFNMFLPIKSYFASIFLSGQKTILLQICFPHKIFHVRKHHLCLTRLRHRTSTCVLKVGYSFTVILGEKFGNQNNEGFKNEYKLS